MDARFLMQKNEKISAKFQWGHPNTGAKYRWDLVQICDSRLSCFISETEQDMDIVTTNG